MHLLSFDLYCLKYKKEEEFSSDKQFLSGQDMFYDNFLLPSSVLFILQYKSSMTRENFRKDISNHCEINKKYTRT